MKMLKIFNSIQLVSLFAAMPFITQWVKDANFYAHNILFWVLIIGYLISFGVFVSIVSDSLD